MDERARFERWLAGYVCGSVGEIFGNRAPEGGYEDRAYDLAWAAWRARGYIAELTDRSAPRASERP